FIFQIQEFFPFRLQHFGYLNKGTFSNNIGYIFTSNFSFYERIFNLMSHLFLDFIKLFLTFFDFSVTDYSYYSLFTISFGSFGIRFKILDFDFGLLNAIHQTFLVLPFGENFVSLFFKVG